MFHSPKIKQATQLIRTHYPRIILLILVVFLSLTNAVHDQYPDEFDSISGGKFIAHGQLPYTGFFTHHNPGAYFLAAAIYLISGASFVKFRLLYQLLIAAYLFGTTSYLLKPLKKPHLQYLATALDLFILLAATHNWTHMLLADSLAAILLVPPLLAIFLHTYYKKPLNTSHFSLITFLLFFIWFTSWTYVYLVAFLHLFSAILFLSPKPNWKKPGQATLILLAPYLLFGLFLLATGSLNNYYYQAFDFNRQHYVYTRDGTDTQNPVRIAIITTKSYFFDYYTGLLDLKKLPLEQPFIPALIIGNTALWIYLITKRRWSLLFLSLSTNILTTFRAGPLSQGETDYQAAVYHLSSFANTALFLWLAARYLATKKSQTLLRDTTRLLFFATAFAWFFMSLFIFSRWLDKTYQRYMGTLPLIYDRPQLQGAIDQLIEPNQSYLIYPFGFKEYFFTHNQNLASNFHIIIPAMNHTPHFQQQILQDLQTTQPPLIVWDQQYFILGSLPGDFLKPYLDQHYLTPAKWTQQNQQTLQPAVDFDNYDPLTTFYLRRDLADQLIQKMLDLDFISQ